MAVPAWTYCFFSLLSVADGSADDPEPEGEVVSMVASRPCGVTVEPPVGWPSAFAAGEAFSDSDAPDLAVGDEAAVVSVSFVCSTDEEVFPAAKASDAVPIISKAAKPVSVDFRMRIPFDRFEAPRPRSSGELTGRPAPRPTAQRENWAAEDERSAIDDEAVEPNI
jgi:hypothetical protein